MHPKIHRPGQSTHARVHTCSVRRVAEACPSGRRKRKIEDADAGTGERKLRRSSSGRMRLPRRGAASGESSLCVLLLAIVVLVLH